MAQFIVTKINCYGPVEAPTPDVALEMVNGGTITASDGDTSIVELREGERSIIDVDRRYHPESTRYRCYWPGCKQPAEFEGIYGNWGAGVQIKVCGNHAQQLREWPNVVEIEKQT